MHGVTYTVLADVFGISKESECVFLNKVIRLTVAFFYDEYVKLPETDEEWEVEVCGFIENYGFPAVGAWNGFHIHVIPQLKANFSFKKVYGEQLGFNITQQKIFVCSRWCTRKHS